MPDRITHVNFPQAIKLAYRNCVKFSGRASRSEYWYFILFFWIIPMVVGLAHESMNPGKEPPEAITLLLGLWMLANMLPALALGIRRFHDMGRRGWWILLSFIPYVGGFIVMIWFCFRGTAGDNRFGPDPLAT